jgi:hypothetical protein
MLEHSPHRKVRGGHKQQNSDDGAHRNETKWGFVAGKRTRPRDPTKSAAIEHNSATRFNNSYDAVAF